MNKILLLMLVTVLAVSTSFANPFYVYTAVKDGWWNDHSVWHKTLRTDGVQKTKIIIPSPYTISVDSGPNDFGFGDIELTIAGVLRIAPYTTLNFTSASVIELKASGSVLGTKKSERIFLGGMIKYNGSIDREKTGAAIANAKSGVSPNGFAAAGSSRNALTANDFKTRTYSDRFGLLSKSLASK